MMYLYVKTHNTTGLKYLGKTVKEDYHSYPGSGKRWIRHLNEHGFDYSTEILLATEDKQEFKETAVFFSRLWNIVSSDEWANFRIEEGDGGDTSIFVDHVKRGKSISETKNSDEWKNSVGLNANAKISIKAKQRWSNDEYKNSIREKISSKQKDPDWKAKHYKECVCCNRLISPGNYQKHVKSCVASSG